MNKEIDLFKLESPKFLSEIAKLDLSIQYLKGNLMAK